MPGTTETTEVKDLAQKASAQAKNLVEQQKGTIAESLSGVARALSTTGEQLENERQSGLASYAQDAASSLHRLAASVQQKDMASIRRDAEQIARDRPALFLGGCVALGFAISRFLKASEERPHTPSSVPLDEYAAEPPSRFDDDLGGGVATVGAHHEEGWQP